MANFKANRTEEDILREMTAILRELKDPRIDPMLTVVRAELSRDLSDCKIRRSPVLHFVADDSIAHSAEIDRMLHQIQPAVEDIPEDDSTEKE